MSNIFNIEFRGLDKDQLQKSMADDEKHKYCFEFIPKELAGFGQGKKPVDKI